MALTKRKLPLATRLGKLSRQRPMLVHTMGKVGSSTLYDRYKVLLDFPVLHTHILGENQKELRSSIKKLGSKGSDLFPHHLAHSVVAWDVINNSRATPLAITVVRDPFERNISAYFQDLPKDSYQNFSVQQLIADFLENYNHSHPKTWFDREFARPFGIDVFGERIQVSERVWSYKSSRNKLEALLGRTDALGQLIKETDLKLELRHPPEIEPKNITSENYNKIGKEKYEEFLDKIRYPADVGKSLLESKVVTTFFEPDEIEAMGAKWLK